MDELDSRGAGRSAVVRDRLSDLGASLRVMVIVRLVALPWALLQVLTRESLPYPPGIRDAALGLVAVLAFGNGAIALTLRRPPSLRRARIVGVIGLALDVAVTSGFVWLHSFDHTAALWTVLFVPPLEGAIVFALGGAMGAWAAGTVLYAARDLWGSAHYGYDFSWNSISFRMGVGFLIAAVVGVMARNLRRDRSQLAAALAGVADRERRLAEAQRVANIGSWEWDVARDSVTWSGQLHRIYGVDEESFDGSYAAYLDRIHPEDRAMVDAAVRASFGDGTSFEFEHRIVRPDGDVRTVHGRGEVARAEDGSVVRMFGTAMDVTEQKLAEKALARYAQRLEEVNGELQRANGMKDDFLAATNHELRTPLTTILGCARTLRERWDDVPDEERRRFVAAIERQGERLHALVEDLLTLSAIDARGLQLSLQPVDVRKAIEASVQSAGVEPGAVSVSCPAGLRALADFRRVQQIVVNLVANALKYGAPPIAIEAIDKGEDVELRVRDAGPGVPDGFVPQLFEKFAQASGGLVSKSKGTGLGLAIVHELARAQNGAAWYEPNRPQGACFCVRLPQASDFTWPERASLSAAGRGPETP